MSRRLPIIDVPRPCPESWDSMSGIGAARDCFVCGPPALIEALKHRLARLGVPHHQIHYEKFEL